MSLYVPCIRRSRLDLHKALKRLNLRNRRQSRNQKAVSFLDYFLNSLPYGKKADSRWAANEFTNMFCLVVRSVPLRYRTLGDSCTTLFALQNWLVGVCIADVDSAYLYGTHPTVGRVYAVASAKSAGSIMAAYYLRGHHSKFWSLPLSLTRR
jgi:hypothetical protein